MPGPGFEPGLLRPQRSVLTTRRSRLTILPTAGLQTENFVPYGATLGEISGSLQHSLVWTLQSSISNDLSSSVVTMFFYFCSWLITTTVTSTRSSPITLKAQPHNSSNHCQTVTWANVLSCAVHIRFHCDCAKTT